MTMKSLLGTAAAILLLGTSAAMAQSAIADVVGDFVYARLQKGNDDIKTCYPPKQLDALAKRFQLWAGGGEPDDLPHVDDSKPKKMPRDVFAYVIHEGKVRAPAGAMELIARVK